MRDIGKAGDMKNPLPNQAGREADSWRCPASKIVLIYLLVGGMWILFSDMLLRWITADADLTERIAIFKGLFFVVATGGMLFLLIRKWFARVGQSDAKLQASEERYQQLAVHSPDAIYLHEKERVTFANPTMCQLLGARDATELIGRSVLKIIHPDFHALVRERWKVLFAGQPVPVAEMKFIRLDGSVVAVEAGASLITSPGHEEIQVIVRDITKRQQTEETLRNSEQRYRSLFDNMTEGFAHCRMLFENGRPVDFIYLDVNDAFTRQTGLKDVVGRKVSEVIPGICETDPELLERYGRVALTGQPERFENYVPTMQMWFDISVYSPEKEHFVAVFDVITERKETEKALRASEARFRQIAASIEDVLYGVSSENSEFNFMSPVFERMLGYTLEDVTRMGGREKFLAEVIQGGQFEKQRTVFRKLQAAPAITAPRWQAWWRCKDGSLKFIEDFWLPVYFEGGLQCTYGVLRDITERKKAESALQESEFFFKESQRAAKIGSYKCDFITNIWKSSEILDQILGIDASHAKNVQGWLAIVHPDDRAMMQQYLLEEVIGKRQRFDKEYRILRPSDGETRWVHGLGELGFDAAGKVVSMTGTILDITERKKAEQALRLLNRLYSLLSRVNELIIHSHSDQELFQGVCDAAINQGGFKLAWIGLVNEETQQVLPAALTGEAADYVRRLQLYCTEEQPGGRGPTGICIRTGQAYVSNDYLKDPCTAPWHEWARPHRLLASVSMPFRRDGKIIGALMIYNDEVDCFAAPDVALVEEIAKDISFALDNLATQRKARQLSRAVEQSPVSIVITNAQGNIEYVNPKFTQVTGYSPAEALGKNPRILKSGELSLNQADTYKELWNTITAGRDWHGEFHNKKKNGEYYWEAAAISPIFDSSGKITHFVAIKEDITAHKHMEEELRQVQKMQAIGQLAAGVAHDFNNILTVIMGNVSLLKMGMLPAGKQAEALTHISNSAERAASLARQLLLFSRRQSLQLQNLDLNETIANFSKMLHSLIGENIALATRYTNGSTPVYADPGTLEQVVMNLVVNARDALPPAGGQITIQTENIHLDESSVHDRLKARPGDFIRLSVSDNGCGISPENLQHIFEPFFTTKKIGKGTGLGLAMVFGIIEQHKGWIEVESQVGAGTTFQIYLPRLAAKMNAPAIPPYHAPEPGGTETILLAEDDPAVSITTRSILEQHGYRVLSAETGEAAIKVWTENQASIRLLITDMVMPGDINGQQLARHLKAIKPDLKVIYVSGYNSEKLTDSRSLRQDPNFIAKPFSIEAILRKVRSVLDARD